MAQEFKYLTTLTRDFLREDPMGAPCPDGLDWDAFFKLCFDHRVGGSLLPLVHRAGLDAEILARLEQEQKTAAEATILRLLYLERILPELENAGCRPIVLKGCVMATRYYRRPEQRFLADLDILVEPENLDAACSVLAGLGLGMVNTIADPTYYRDHHFHWIMGNGNGFIVEVHWALTLPRSIIKFDLDGLRERARSVPLNGIRMLAPSPADLLLHIATQCTAGGFGEMRWVIDAALVLPALEDPAALVDQALEQNQGRALWLLLNQAHRWTGAPVPDEITRRLYPGDRTARLLERLAEGMLAGPGQFRHRSEIHQLMHWLCTPTSSLRRREIARFLSPGEDYWLEIGFTPDSPPGPLVRLLARLSRLKSLFHLVGTALFYRPRRDSAPD